MCKPRKENVITIDMKRILILLFTSFVYCSCNKTEPKNTPTKADELKMAYSYADSELEDEVEKVALISIIKKIPTDSLKFIMRDYLAKTYYDDSECEKIIDTISKKYKYSKTRIATLIFCYRYETLTKENSIDESTENEQEMQEQMEDDSEQ